MTHERFAPCGTPPRRRVGTRAGCRPRTPRTAFGANQESRDRCRSRAPGGGVAARGPRPRAGQREASARRTQIRDEPSRGSGAQRPGGSAPPCRYVRALRARATRLLPRCHGAAGRRPRRGRRARGPRNAASRPVRTRRRRRPASSGTIRYGAQSWYARSGPE